MKRAIFQLCTSQWSYVSLVNAVALKRISPRSTENVKSLISFISLFLNFCFYCCHLLTSTKQFHNVSFTMLNQFAFSEASELVDDVRGTNGFDSGFILKSNFFRDKDGELADSPDSDEVTMTPPPGVTT